MQKVAQTEDKVCNGRHPTILPGIKIEKRNQREEVAATTATPNSKDEVKCVSINTGSNLISMCTVPMKIKGSSGNEVICTYALLDTCRQGTFILDQLRDHLYIPGRETSVTIKTINGELKQNSREMNSQLTMMTSLNQDN